MNGNPPATRTRQAILPVYIRSQPRRLDVQRIHLDAKRRLFVRSVACCCVGDCVKYFVDFYRKGDGRAYGRVRQSARCDCFFVRVAAHLWTKARIRK